MNRLLLCFTYHIIHALLTYELLNLRFKKKHKCIIIIHLQQLWFRFFLLFLAFVFIQFRHYISHDCKVIRYYCTNLCVVFLFLLCVSSSSPAHFQHAQWILCKVYHVLCKLFIIWNRSLTYAQQHNIVNLHNIIGSHIKNMTTGFHKIMYPNSTGRSGGLMLMLRNDSCELCQSHSRDMLHTSGRSLSRI